MIKVTTSGDLLEQSQMINAKAFTVQPDGKLLLRDANREIFAVFNDHCWKSVEAIEDEK